MWSKLHNFYSQVIEIPQAGGLYHILYVCSAIALTIFLLFAFQKANRKMVRGAMIFTWIFIFLNEIIFRQFVQIAKIKTLEGAIYDATFAPVQIISLFLWILPLYFAIPVRKWEKVILPFIGISGLTIGGFVLVCPAFIFNKNIPNNTYYMMTAVFTFALSCYIILKGKLAINDWKTYTFQLLFMSAIILISILLNEIVYRDTSNANVLKGWNFAYISHRWEPLPYYNDFVTNGFIKDTNTNLGLFVALFVAGLIVFPIIPYASFYMLFRPFVKSIDDRILSNNKTKEVSKTSCPVQKDSLTNN
ncbi:hypothetical protein [Mycoplasmopsis primatum]|uniref:hypothetical protein n=1 Tax=Mycoplasmopsis primatum TaxID=55604 RepID=UPI000690E58A|nr:hypothetical protein [Mycoplasmopsis primatum]